MAKLSDDSRGAEPRGKKHWRRTRAGAIAGGLAAIAVAGVALANSSGSEESAGIGARISGAVDAAFRKVLGASGETGSENAVSLFNHVVVEAESALSDPSRYELGMKFVPQRNGTVVALSYFRGTEDSDDNDNRTLNLWTAEGEILGSVSVSAKTGEAGWVIGRLPEPVEVVSDTTYVASYGTEGNYVYSYGFFEVEREDQEGLIRAPAAEAAFGNGIYSTEGPGTFPRDSLNATNYWVDVAFVPTESSEAASEGGAADVSKVPIELGQ